MNQITESIINVLDIPSESEYIVEKRKQLEEISAQISKIATFDLAEELIDDILEKDISQYNEGFYVILSGCFNMADNIEPLLVKIFNGLSVLDENELKFVLVGTKWIKSSEEPVRFCMGLIEAFENYRNTDSVKTIYTLISELLSDLEEDSVEFILSRLFLTINQNTDREWLQKYIKNIINILMNFKDKKNLLNSLSSIQSCLIKIIDRK